MAEQAHTTSAPERRRPPAWMNRIVGGILRSPLHGLLSKEMMLIGFTGRKSGKEFTTPVSMITTADGVKFFVGSPWYKNLRGGARVKVRIAGRERSGVATVHEDPELILREAKAFLAERGLKSGFRIGLPLDSKSPPSDEQLAEMLKGRAIVAIALR